MAVNSSKLKLLHILKMLYEKTDADNTLSTSEIIEELGKYDIDAERKSINADINTLKDFGMSIEMKRSGKYGYYMADRSFTLPEIKILVDSIQSAKFISKTKSMEIIGKLLSELSEKNAKIVETEVFIKNRIKAENDEVFASIDVILKAIKSNRKIDFKYFEYDTDKHKNYRFNGYKFVLSPYALTWLNDKYYLVANNSKYDNLTHYNIDRITEACILEEKRRDFSEVSEYKTFFNVGDYTKNLHGMMSGTKEMVEIRFSNELISTVIDKFGVEITIKEKREDTFVARIMAEVSDVFLAWVFTFGSKAEVLTPEVREVIRKKVEEVSALYL
ncbi:MAG TPA: WYL domain-containing protein [Clostridiaceae bacterium]|nr:WYL domain-containing protein [Clostridiaceae bacterium]